VSRRVISEIGQISVDWLDTVLARSGALSGGRVRDYEAQHVDSTNARFVRIRLAYEAGSSGTLPETLLLKLCSGKDGSFGPSEVQYYTRDYAGLADAPIPACYDARYSDEPRGYHILMDDLTATHRNNWDVAPTLAHGCAVAEALVALHAHWWDAARLPEIDAKLPGAPEIRRYIDAVQPGLEPLLEDVADEIDDSWKRTLMEIFAHHPALMLRRTQDPTGFTLVHGDVNSGNILSPREGWGKTYLVDRQPFDWSLTTWLGVSDLAYMMVLWWDTELRRQLELDVLRHYHQSLSRRGIAGYSLEQLLRDYRLAAVQGVYVATEWCKLEEDRVTMKWVWFRHLQRSMAAFTDLRCGELWPGR
jgi:hypothetical protein